MNAPEAFGDGFESLDAIAARLTPSAAPGRSSSNATGPAPVATPTPKRPKPDGVVDAGELDCHDAIAMALTTWRETHRPHTEALTDEQIAAVAWSNAQVLEPMFDWLFGRFGKHLAFLGPVATAVATTSLYLKGPVRQVLASKQTAPATDTEPSPTSATLTGDPDKDKWRFD